MTYLMALNPSEHSVFRRQESKKGAGYIFRLRKGALELWEQRGFPDGCIRVDNPTGDRLACSKRYQ